VHIIIHPLSAIVTLVIMMVHLSKFSEGPWHLQLLLVGFTNVGIVLQRVLSIFVGYGCLHFPLGEGDCVALLCYTSTTASVDVSSEPCWIDEC
jgi:hypothetical protein